MLLSESLVLGQVVPQVTTCHQIDDQVQVLPVVKSIVHVHEKGVVKLAQELFFIDNRVHTPLGNDPSLQHLLHCEELMCFLLLYFPNLAEASSAYHV